MTGASVVAPTGNYDQNKPTNISTGDFYTLRPGIQIGWRPTDRIAVGAKALWLQIGVRHDAALAKAQAAGLAVVQDHCTLVEHQRLQAAGLLSRNNPV